MASSAAALSSWIRSVRLTPSSPLTPGPVDTLALEAITARSRSNQRTRAGERDCAISAADRGETADLGPLRASGSRRAPLRDAVQWARPPGLPKRAVNQKVLPAPGTLRT